MTEVKFELSLDAIGKPRITKNWWAKRDKVNRYNAWKDHVRHQMRVQGVKIPKDPVGLEFTVYIPMPKSWPKKKQYAFMATFHNQKPDIDNVAKAMMDCIFEEDKCVGVLNCRKVWVAVDDPPKWEVKVWAPN